MKLSDIFEQSKPEVPYELINNMIDDIMEMFR